MMKSKNKRGYLLEFTLPKPSYSFYKVTKRYSVKI